MNEAWSKIRLKKWYLNNRNKAVQAGAGCFLTTLKRCLGVLRLPFGQPGDFPRIFGVRAGEPNCAKISGKLCWTRCGVSLRCGFCQGKGWSSTIGRDRKSNQTASATNQRKNWRQFGNVLVYYLEPAGNRKLAHLPCLASGWRYQTIITIIDDLRIKSVLTPIPSPFLKSLAQWLQGLRVLQPNLVSN